MPISYSDEGVVGISGATFALILGVDKFRTEMGEKLGIGVTGLMTLNLLRRHGPTTAGHLAGMNNLTSGSMTATIDKLESHDFVSRSPSTTDRRSIVVTITPLGTEAINWALRFYREALAEALELNPDADSSALNSYLSTAGALILAKAQSIPEPDWG